MEFVDYKCLESLLIEGEELIATEGIGEKIKNAAKFIGKGLMNILHAIRKVLSIIVNKLKALISNKRKKESPKEAVVRITKENNELKAKLSKLKNSLRKGSNNNVRKANEAFEFSKDQTTGMIAALEKKIARNEVKLADLKKVYNQMDYYDDFRGDCIEFVELVNKSIRIVRSYLPKIVNDAKKYDNRGPAEDLSLNELYNIDYMIMATHRPSKWPKLYESLTENFDKVKYLFKYANIESNLTNGFQNLVKESTQTIDYLENMVKNMNNNPDNPAYRMIISNLTGNSGFVPMLQSSINLANKILNGYIVSDEPVDKGDSGWIDSIDLPDDNGWVNHIDLPDDNGWIDHIDLPGEPKKRRDYTEPVERRRRIM